MMRSLRNSRIFRKRYEQNPSVGELLQMFSRQTPHQYLAFMNFPGADTQQFAPGFTLIEVVIVMAIIAILALMTIPMFYAKIPRTQVEESLPLADIAKNAVAAYYQKKKALPADNATADLPEANKLVGNYVTAVTVKDGAVTMTFGNNSNAKITGKRLTWRPAIVIDTPITPVSWVCAGKKVPDKMEAGGVNVTDVPLDTMPVSCR